MGGYVYHVLNRGVGRATLFSNSGDFAAFERVLQEARDRVPMRLLAACVLPNHCISFSGRSATAIFRSSCAG
jgi:putative transposase